NDHQRRNASEYRAGLEPTTEASKDSRQRVSSALDLFHNFATSTRVHRNTRHRLDPGSQPFGGHSKCAAIVEGCEMCLQLTLDHRVEWSILPGGNKDFGFTMRNHERSSFPSSAFSSSYTFANALRARNNLNLAALSVISNA